MFADDTNLSFAGRTPSDIGRKVNADLSNVNDWLQPDKLTLNTGKTEFMLMASKEKLDEFRANLRIDISGSTIKQVELMKILAITIDNELK